MFTRSKAALAALVVAATSLFAVVVNAPAAQARTNLAVGMTSAWPRYEDTFIRYQGYHIDSMRVFASNGQGLPSWNDQRIQRLKEKSIVPFISWKDVVSTTTLINWINAMPSDIKRVYLAHCHECEANMDAATYKSRQVMYWNAINTLSPAMRAKVKFGPIQTKQWTENTAGRSYATYDPGIGDFWGVDAYVNTWDLDNPNAVYPDLGYPEHVSWLQRIRDYNTGGRPKWLPELGTVSAYYDDDDQNRALWISRVMGLIQADTQFQLVLWWHEEGTTGSNLPYYGTQRNFLLHERVECNSSGGSCVMTPVVHSQIQWKSHLNGNTPPASIAWA